jgi:hypothetical protein
MKKYYGIFALLLMVAFTTLSSGCSQTCQRIKADGSIIGTVSGAQVVVKQSGGVITDVFLLDNALVKSEAGSDGWLFLDQNGNPVHIGGDMKSIRCNNDKQEVFAQYVEYHQDVDRCTYIEKYNKSKGLSREGLTPASMDIKIGSTASMDIPVALMVVPTR